MKVVEQIALKLEAKRLRELMSKLGYSRRQILAVLWFYGVELGDMGDCPKLGIIY